MHPNPDRLTRVPLFAALSDPERERVASWLDIEDQPAGTRLTHDGAADYAFFVLDSGEARVERDGREVNRLQAGDVFDELAMFGDGRRVADVVAVTDVRILLMFGTHFREMQTQLPSVAATLRELAAERLSTLDGGPE